jgi:hypothetical protein
MLAREAKERMRNEDKKAARNRRKGSGKGREGEQKRENRRK